jgi:hypothetical protein
MGGIFFLWAGLSNVLSYYGTATTIMMSHHIIYILPCEWLELFRSNSPIKSPWQAPRPLHEAAFERVKIRLLEALEIHCRRHLHLISILLSPPGPCPTNTSKTTPLPNPGLLPQAKTSQKHWAERPPSQHPQASCEQ